VTHARGIWRQRPFGLGGAVSRGVPCTFQGPVVGPTLAVDDPVLGARMEFSLTAATPGAAAVVYLSTVPAAPIPISPGCFLQLDPTTMAFIGSFAIGGGGTGTLPLDLPSMPILVGRRLSSQAATVALPTLQLSNGQELTLGF
jgi:hypothetical protein